MRRLLLILGVLLVAGCGVPDPVPVPSGASTASTTPVQSRVPAPAAITIPSIGAHSTLIPLGLTPERALDAPPVTEPMQAGWYSPGPEPGQVGPAVIAGHVDGQVDGMSGQPGIFYRLRELAAGAEVLVDQADGSHLRFVVDRVEHHDKDAFPTGAVYGDVDRPELRLITCGGSFDREARSYRENIIVWAVLA
jgi:sortase (surface protein transpeptidase)